jgi:hypothetical protein
VATGRDWGRIFRIAATAGFVASAVLHLATFTPLPPARAAAGALVLFAGAFALLAALIVLNLFTSFGAHEFSSSMF